MIFFFKRKVPAKETTLKWKAYQTYADGSVVRVGHDPKLFFKSLTMIPRKPHHTQ